MLILSRVPSLVTTKTSHRAVTQAAGNGRLKLFWIIAALAVLAGCVFLSVTVGARAVGWADIWAAFGGATGTIEEAAIARRIPRTILAAIAGASLGVSGALMQGLTRNPLADPGLLGVNMGASLAVVIGVAFFGLSSGYVFIWVAIFGAGLTAVIVYAIGSLGYGGATPLKLTLAGAAISIAFSAIVSAIVLPRNDIAEGVRAWHIGGVGGASYAKIGVMVPFILAGLALTALCAEKLNALALGDEAASGLGERVNLARLMAALAAVALCGTATALCGPISFVGLVVPHFCRLTLGPDHRWLIMGSALAGAALLVASDTLGRVLVPPTELEAGLVTAIIGAPIFIAFVRSHRTRGL